MKRICVIVFPGSNCDKDVFSVFKNFYEIPIEYVWYNKDNLDKFDAIIVPGGFSFGDRLRAGIIASHSPIMKAVKKASMNGIPILGICNGFQILVESNLLPGALIRNETLRFVCKWTDLIVKNNKTPFTNLFASNERFTIPIAHGEGRYMIEENEYNKLEKNNQIVFTYETENPNGSLRNIAGICNKEGNVMGMMPHPERNYNNNIAVTTTINNKSLGNSKLIFDSLINYLKTSS